MSESSTAGAIGWGAPGDAPTVAHLHAAGIQEGFLATLGTHFLTLLYRAMAESDEAVLLVARREDRVVGFAAGALVPAAFYRTFVRGHGARAAAVLAPRAIRPATAAGIWETLTHLRHEGEREPELLAIVVDPGARRGGIGAALVARLEQELARDGADRLGVVVAAGNAAARAFYERQGFGNPRPVQVHRGRTSIRYVKSLDLVA